MLPIMAAFDASAYLISTARPEGEGFLSLLQATAAVRLICHSLILLALSIVDLLPQF